MNPETAAKFEALLDLEHAVRMDTLTSGMAPTPWERDRAAASLVGSKKRLFEAVDALTPAEQAAYGEYRKAAQA